MTLTSHIYFLERIVSKLEKLEYKLPEMVKARIQGVSTKQIAIKYGVCYTTMLEWLALAGEVVVSPGDDKCGGRHQFISRKTKKVLREHLVCRSSLFGRNNLHPLCSNTGRFNLYRFYPEDWAWID